MSDPFEPFAVQSGQGVRLKTPPGDSVYVKTNTTNTRGSLTVLEFVIAPLNGPALHTHPWQDEVWWVLEGDFRFKAGGAMFRVPQGGMAFGPRGTPHTFQNIGTAPGRLLVITAPAGAERLFEEYAKLLPGPVDPDVLSALGHATGVDFVGPPLAVSDPVQP